MTGAAVNFGPFVGMSRAASFDLIGEISALSRLCCVPGDSLFSPDPTRAGLLTKRIFGAVPLLGAVVPCTKKSADAPLILGG